MGQFTEKFYRKGANMGRALNAMMMAGFGEMAASYIESKIAMAKIDAMEFAYQAIAALARGDFAGAGSYAIAAAQAGLIAGAGSLLAGYIRSQTQAKAESMTRTQEENQAAADRQGEADESGTRTKAAGVVNQRPIIITVQTSVNISAGVVSFADNEYGSREFYARYIREQVESDIESGVISVP
jgi:hypothetical protein